MALTLSEKEKRAVASIVNERANEHLSRFPYFRYPVEPLEEWKRLFADPKTVPSETLRNAISWAYGGHQRKGMPFAHRKTLIHVIKAWPDFAESAAHDPEQALRFWEQRLPDWQSGFDAAAFLLHLTRPDAIELADQHRLLAMLELLKEIGHQESDRTLSRSFQDLEMYTQFFRSVMPKLSFGQKNRIQFDRFLKVFGNRNAYTNVRKDYAVREPEIRLFSWSDCAAERFDLSPITLRSNADVLFACLLLSLDKRPADLEALTIGMVVERLPVGTAGICNSASFNYAMVALFGRQKGRDYFQLENSFLAEAFTEQANQSTRDMQFYKKWADVKLTINPKYLKSNP